MKIYLLKINRNTNLRARLGQGWLSLVAWLSAGSSSSWAFGRRDSVPCWLLGFPYGSLHRAAHRRGLDCIGASEPEMVSKTFFNLILEVIPTTLAFPFSPILHYLASEKQFTPNFYPVVWLFMAGGLVQYQ